MINAMQVISIPHWTKDELVMAALFHLKGRYKFCSFCNREIRLTLSNDRSGWMRIMHFAGFTATVVIRNSKI